MVRSYGIDLQKFKCYSLLSNFPMKTKEMSNNFQGPVKTVEKKPDF